MSDQPLVPFKAYFEFQYNDNLNKLYPEHLETYLQRSSDDAQTVKTATFLKNYLTGAKLPIFLKGRKVDLDYHTRHSIYPESFSVTNLSQSVEFKVKSDEVTVIQIVKDDITFRTSSGEVRTETLTDQIKLFSL